MRYAEVADHSKVYVCRHVFERAAPVNVVATEEDGSLAMTCGCVPDEVRTVGFGHLRDRVPDLLERELQPAGTHLWRPDAGTPWVARAS